MSMLGGYTTRIKNIPVARFCYVLTQTSSRLSFNRQIKHIFNMEISENVHSKTSEECFRNKLTWQLCVKETNSLNAV